MIKIDRGVPIAKRQYQGSRKYPFPDMVIGDSLYFENRYLGLAANAWGRVNKCKFMTRKEGEGYRTWRIA